VKGIIDNGDERCLKKNKKYALSAYFIIDSDALTAHSLIREVVEIYNLRKNANGNKFF
jgi:hypothetical protein